MNVIYFFGVLLFVPLSINATNFGDAWRGDWHETSEPEAQHPSAREESISNIKAELREPKKIEITVTQRQINWFNLGSGVGLAFMGGLATRVAVEKKMPPAGVYAAGCAYAAYQLLKYSVTKTTAKVEKPTTLPKPKPAPKPKIIFEFDADDWMTP